MQRVSGRTRIRVAKGASRHAEDSFHDSMSRTRSAVAGDARQNFDPVLVTGSTSADDVTSDRTASNEKEGGNSMEAEAGGDSGAQTVDDSSSGGSSGYQAPSPTLSGTQNSDEDTGGTRACDLQRSNQLMNAMMIDCLTSSSATTASALTRQSSRVRSRQHHAKLKPDAALDKDVYTLMLRQIPRHYTQLMFLIDISSCGFMGLVDFIYIQFDARKGKNVGYGFISFTETRHASAFLQKFDGAYMDVETGRQGKPLRIHPASVQGYEDNFVHFAETRAGMKSDSQSVPLFMPRGSWSGLPREIQKELLALREPLGDQTPGWPRAEPAEDSRLLIRLSHHLGGAQDHGDLDSGPHKPQAWGQDLCSEHFVACGLDEIASAIGAWSGTAPAKTLPATQPPPGLLLPARWSFTCPVCGVTDVGPDNLCSRCHVRSLPLEQRPPREPPRCPSAPDDGLLPATEEGLPWSSQAPGGDGRCGHHKAAAPALGLELMGVYQELEERRLSLLTELAMVHEKQRRALAICVQGSMGGCPSPQLLAAIPGFDQHGLGTQCERVVVGLPQM
jgi:hypothetical protein